MWAFASKCVAGNARSKNKFLKPTQDAIDCSDDETSSLTGQEEGLECPICWESFNIVENIPYVLWCGHTLCKNCILALQWAVIKFPTLPLQLPLFISCPWCNLLSLRVVYRGTLKFPQKNYFLLWMLESLTGERIRSHSAVCGDHQPTVTSRVNASGTSNSNQLRHRFSNDSESSRTNDHHHNPSGYQGAERLRSSLRNSLLFLFNMTAKFPLVMMFLLIILYAIPASAAILTLYIPITLLFALPSFLLLYFAYPMLDWLVREIVS